MVAVSVRFFGLGPLVKSPFAANVLNDFLSLMYGSSSTTQSAFPSNFFGLGVTNKAAKSDCVLPIGDDGSMYEDCSSGELIVMIINET